jgi:hypothetical protein
LKLLKLCKDGRIPRREVNELLYDMMSVGLWGINALTSRNAVSIYTDNDERDDN